MNWDEHRESLTLIEGITTIIDAKLLEMAESCAENLHSSIPRRLFPEVIAGLHNMARAAYLVGMEDNREELYGHADVAAMLGVGVASVRVKASRYKLGVLIGGGHVFTIRDIHELAHRFGWGGVQRTYPRTSKQAPAWNWKPRQPVEAWHEYFKACAKQAEEYKALLGGRNLARKIEQSERLALKRQAAATAEE